MSARHSKPTRVRATKQAAVIGTAAAVGIALGSGGASLALWNDAASFSGQIAAGYEYFAAGHVGAPHAAEGGAAAVTIGADEAAALVENGVIAVAFQTDSISQGNKGLRYDVVEPDWGSHIFGAADVAVFPVATAEECAIDTTPPASPALSSTPVSAAYSDTEVAATEYWCLVATLDQLPDEGAYENTGMVSAHDPTGTEVTDASSWNADVISAMDPEDEADHAIVFDYETFRPGEVTP